jgi:hypothetical protein
VTEEPLSAEDRVELEKALELRRIADQRWLHCWSCGDAVPEHDATVICIECGEGMVWTANAAALTEAEEVVLLRYRQTDPGVCLRCSRDNHIGLCLAEAIG